MDTSDSEGCFESADEDFHSEDEAYERIESSNTDRKGSGVKKHELLVTASRPEFGVPPEIPECWEPGMHLKQHKGENNNPGEESKPKLGILPTRVGLQENASCPRSESETPPTGAEEGSQSKSNSRPRPEFGIPPARVECWVPEMHREQQKHGNNNRPEFEIPPSRVECWEPGIQQTDSDNCLGTEPGTLPSGAGSETQSKDNSKPRPEFSVPPARVECWEPEVDDSASPEFRMQEKFQEANKDDENSNANDNELILKMQQVKIVDTKNNNTIQEDNTAINPNLEESIIKKLEENIKGKNRENKAEEEENKQETGRNEVKSKNSNKNEDGLLEGKKRVDTLQQGKLEEVNSGDTNNDKYNYKEIEESKKKSGDDDGPSQKDLWNEDDGWGWNEDEEEETNLDVDIKTKTESIKKHVGAELTKKKTEHDVMEKQENYLWKGDRDWNNKSLADSNLPPIFSEKNVESEKNMWEGDWNVNPGSKQVKNIWGDDGCTSGDKIGPKEEDDDCRSGDKKRPKEEDLWGDDEDWLDNSNIKAPNISNTNQENNLNKTSKHDITKALENLVESPSKENSWGVWGTWGISSVLSTAANITSSVSQGITTALETGIGVPDPEELARLHKAEHDSSPQPTISDEPPPGLTFGLTNLVSGVSTITKLVESTSNKVISGGLDTLETIGKKTMEVLQENDPGLKKKRAFLKIEQDKPVLSQILREAKEKAEEENREREKLHYSKKANYETIFDDHQGLVHLEALEMLSKQCEIKLQSVISKTPADTMADLQETLDQVKELCELLDEDEDEGASIEEIKEKIDGAVADVKVPISYVKLLDRWGDTERWLLDLEIEKVGENEVHHYAIESLAELTALSVEQFHKAGELLLVKEHRSTADEADSLVQLTTVLTGLISMAASKFSEKLNARPMHWGSKEAVNSLITNVFLEAANSSRYIQDAFQLLIPVLQVGAV